MVIGDFLQIRVREGVQNFLGPWPLDRQEAHFVGSVLKRHIERLRTLGDPLPILDPSSGVHHQHEVIGHTIDDEIVENTTVLGTHRRVLALPHRQTLRIVYAHELHQIESLGAADQELPHVRNVEDTAHLTHGPVLSRNPSRVLDRHLIAGKRHHLGPETKVHIVEGGLAKRFVHGVKNYHSVGMIGRGNTPLWQILRPAHRPGNQRM